MNSRKPEIGKLYRALTGESWWYQIRPDEYVTVHYETHDVLMFVGAAEDKWGWSMFLGPDGRIVHGDPDRKLIKA